MRSYKDDFNAVLKQWQKAAKLEGAAARDARALTERLVHAFRKRVDYYLKPLVGKPALFVNRDARFCILMSRLKEFKVVRLCQTDANVYVNYSGFEIDFPVIPDGPAQLAVRPASSLSIQEADFDACSDVVECPVIETPWNKRDGDVYITSLDREQFEIAYALMVAGVSQTPAFGELIDWVDQISKIKKDPIEAEISETEMENDLC